MNAVSKNLPALFVVGILGAAVALIAWKFLSAPGDDDLVSVNVPQLSEAALAGRAAFDANCAQCHGVNGAGSDRGPPLVHDIYNPGHHSDGAFFYAAKQGVRQHHWRFGNMPPQPAADDRDLELIVRYVRELQQANGIFWKPHRM